MPDFRIASINFECTDPSALAHFWAQILDGEVAVETPAFCAVKTADLFIGAVRVDDYRPPTWPSTDQPQQIHLDLAVDDLDSAEATALRLGATKSEYQAGPDHSRVLHDPAGHPFCLRG
ncbi:VOC family protein [Gordonia sp. DT30]|uniref:VOC family protein n=1 Tax=unclassified Gordonia (in: high G+C Gram-positive bacteria) TaxID=2657482 RepID=UPI003CF15D9A